VGVAQMSLRPECVYVAVREAGVLAGVSRTWVERKVACGELCVWLVRLPGRDGRPSHVYRLDQVLAVKEWKRR